MNKDKQMIEQTENMLEFAENNPALKNSTEYHTWVLDVYHENCDLKEEIEQLK